MHPAADVLRPAALVERRHNTKKQAQYARDVTVSIGYLIVTHVVIPLIVASLLLNYRWTSDAMVASIPLSVIVAVSYGYRTRKNPRKITWEFPNAVQVPGGQWQFTKRDLVINFRWWRHHTIWLRTLAAVIAAGLLAATGHLPWAGLASSVWLWWFLRKLGGVRVTYVSPWHITRVRAGMLQTGVWTAKDLPSFRHIRPIQTNDYGDTVWLSLNGKHHSAVSSKRAAFVAGVGLRDREVTMSHDDTMPADSIQIRFLNGHPRAPKQHWALTAAEDTTT